MCLGIRANGKSRTLLKKLFVTTSWARWYKSLTSLLTTADPDCPSALKPVPIPSYTSSFMTYLDWALADYHTQSNPSIPHFAFPFWSICWAYLFVSTQMQDKTSWGQNIQNNLNGVGMYLDFGIMLPGGPLKEPRPGSSVIGCYPSLTQRRIYQTHHWCTGGVLCRRPGPNSIP